MTVASKTRIIIPGVKPGLASSPGLRGDRPRLTACAIAPSHVTLEFSNTLHLSTCNEGQESRIF
jgi:hypothetical protein